MYHTLNLKAMDVTTYTDFRQDLKSYLDKIDKSHTPLFIKRSNGGDMVVISKADYESMEETFWFFVKNSGNTLLKFN